MSSSKMQRGRGSVTSAPSSPLNVTSIIARHAPQPMHGPISTSDTGTRNSSSSGHSSMHDSNSISARWALRPLDRVQFNQLVRFAPLFADERVRELEQSRTYRLGNALASAPRAVRDRFRKR